MDRRTFLAGTTATLAAPARGGTYLDAFLDEELAGKDFGGTLLVARGQHFLVRRGYGMANRAFAVPAAIDTTFKIASITKLMTAVILMQLVEAGRIGLDRPIAAYLSGYKGSGRETVLIRYLLNHTSGIENFDKALTGYADAAAHGMPAYQLPHTPRALMDQFASGPLVHAPGATFDYNNADYMILGQIIEAVEGAPYEEVLAKRITAPLGMRATTMAESSRIVPRLAPTYYRDTDRPIVSDMPVYGENWYAAGGLCATAEDLLIFSQALYGGRLLSSAGMTVLLQPGLDDYAFGQWVSAMDIKGRKHRFAQRPGRIMGANTLLLRLLDDDLTVIILANTNLVDTDRLGFRIARRVLESA